MGQYGSGVSMEQAFKYDRERIKMALEGQLVDGESEVGFHYSYASSEDCAEFILSAFDNAVYLALEANDAGCVIEELLFKYTGKDALDKEYFHDYMRLIEEKRLARYEDEEENE